MYDIVFKISLSESILLLLFKMFIYKFYGITYNMFNNVGEASYISTRDRVCTHLLLQKAVLALHSDHDNIFDIKKKKKYIYIKTNKINKSVVCFCQL
jgi:hypothetical protein